MDASEHNPIPLLVGVGNAMRSDDGVGIYVARQVAGRSAGRRILEASGEGAALMELWRDEADVLLVDAVRSGAEPGTIHRLDAHAGTLPSEFFNYSTHAFSVAEAVELARVLDALPPRLFILGIEGLRFDYGTELTPAVQATADRVIDELLLQPTDITHIGEPDHA